MTRRLATLALWLAAVAGPAAAQDAPPPPTGAVVVDGVGEVFVTPSGGATTGPAAPGAALAVPAGVPVEVVLAAASGLWNPPRAQATVTVAPGDTVTVALVVPRRVRVESQPAGASVAWERADGTVRPLPGRTPLDADLPPGEAGTLVVRLDGFLVARAPLAPGAATAAAALTPADPLAALPSAERLPTRRSTRARRAVDLGLAAATVAAGALAVHFKFQADAVDDRYRSPQSASRGDEALRQEALRLDRRSAVALGAMQVGVGVLAVRFVLR